MLGFECTTIEDLPERETYCIDSLMMPRSEVVALCLSAFEQRCRVFTDGFTVWIGHPNWQFGRRSAAQEIERLEAALERTQEAIDSLREQYAQYQHRLEQRKQNAARGGASFESITALLQDNPAIMAYAIGPALLPWCPDELLLRPGQLAIVFVPTLFPMVARGDYALTTPLVYMLDEHQDPIALPPTVHPHVREDSSSICLGNARPAVDAAIEANNPAAVIALLDLHTLSYNAEDVYNGDWANQAWHWWARELKDVANQFPRWNGRARLATGTREIVDLQEFFGASLAEIVHVGTALGRVSTRTLEYHRQQVGTAICDTCGGSGTSCPCHNVYCEGCGQHAPLCCCPLMPDHYPPITAVRLYDRVWYRSDSPYRCHKCDAPAEFCSGGTWTWVCGKCDPELAEAFADENRQQVWQYRLTHGWFTRRDRRLYFATDDEADDEACYYSEDEGECMERVHVTDGRHFWCEYHTPIPTKGE